MSQHHHFENQLRTEFHLESKIQQTKMLVTFQRFGDLYLGVSSSILSFRQNIIKVGSKSSLLTCSSNITLSPPSYTGSALKRELDFCNGYLSLLYFCLELTMNRIQFQPNLQVQFHSNWVELSAGQIVMILIHKEWPKPNIIGLFQSFLIIGLRLWPPKFFVKQSDWSYVFKISQ